MERLVGRSLLRRKGLKMPYWEITPHECSDFDSMILPAETEEDHRAALAYAQARLEELWDKCGHERGAQRVSICLHRKKMPADLDLY